MNDHLVRMKAMRFETPEYIPVGCYFLPATWAKYREELSALISRHPIIFGAEQSGQRDYDAVGGTYVQGNHVDEWNCVWSNIQQGCEAFVTGHPLPEREMINDFHAPAPGAGLPHGFMFLRLTYLRGFEESMIDFAEEPAELAKLIDIVYQYNLGEIDTVLAKGAPDIMYFGDDLGTQTALPISPEKWRKYLKPCFSGMYQRCHAAGSAVYMHTDGHIIPIIRDLIKCGVNVVNPQVRANGLANLRRECYGNVCVNLDLDRQMFPFCTPAEIEAHIQESVETLGSKAGGLWLSAECGPDVPLENIEAICSSLERYRGYFSE